MVKEKRAVKKGKRPHKNKPTSKKYLKYSINGEVVKKKPICPRCGPGVFLAESCDRLYCGKCHWTEFKEK